MSLKGSRRIYSSSVLKWMGGSAGILGVALLAFLAATGAITIIDTNGDMSCAGSDLYKDLCIAEISFKANTDVFVYPSEDWGLSTDKPLKSVRLFRTWGSGYSEELASSGDFSGLREYKLNETCKGTWCGGKRGVKDNAYSFALRKDREYTFVYVVEKFDSSDVIKWGFGENSKLVPDQYEKDYVDPVFNPPYEIVGDTVSVDHKDFSINVSPHTMEVGGDITVLMQSKKLSGEYKVAVRTGSELLSPKKLKIKDSVLSYKLVPRWNASSNQTEFDNVSYYDYKEKNESEKIVKEVKIKEDNVSKDVWYEIGSIDLVKNVPSETKIKLDFPKWGHGGFDGKYDLGFYDAKWANAQDAIDNGVFYVIDPWVNGQDALELYWSFDTVKISGTTIIGEDTSPQINGTNSNAVAKTSGCILGECLTFDGSSTFITGIDSDNVSNESTFSVSYWIKAVDNGTGKGVIDTLTGSTGWVVRLNDLTPTITINNGSEWQTAGAGQNLVENVWTHQVWVYNGSHFISYHDGAQTDTGAKGPYQPRGAAGEIFVGKYSTEYFTGSLDEVGMWDRVLTPAEVEILYNNGRATNPYRDVEIQSAMVSYWAFDNDDISNSTLANDTWGSNPGDTILGAVNGSAGILGEAYVFDGDDDYIDAGSIDDFETGIDGDFAISLWTNTTDMTSDGCYRGPFGTGGYASDDLGIKLLNTGHLTSWMGNGQIADGGTNISDGVLHHVVLTRDSGTVNLYVDGVLDGSGSRSTSINFSGIRIGQAPGSVGGTCGNWNGSVDEVGLWHRKLSADEVRKLYNAGRAFNPVTTNVSLQTSLVTYYSMDAAVANSTLIQDEIGIRNATNDGTWINNTATNILHEGVNFNDVAHGDTSVAHPLNGRTSFTMSVWFNFLTGIGANEIILGSQGDVNWFVRASSTKFNIFLGAGSSSISTSANVYNNTWYHAIVACEATVCDVWLNGVKDIDADATGVNSTIIGNLIVGGFSGGALEWAGVLDDIGIWDRKLSDSEIGELWANGAGLNPLNNLPTQGTPILNSTLLTNLSSENLTAYNVSTADADSDSVKNIFNWKKDGSSVQVLNMPFEGGSSSSWNNTYYGYAKDYSGNGYDANVSGALWNATGGYDGLGAYQFVESDEDYILIDGTDSIGLTEFTVSAWIKPADLTSGNHKTIVSKNGATSGWRFTLYSTQKLMLQMNNGTWLYAESDVLPTPNIWYHVAATFDGTNQIVYVDGVTGGTDKVYGGTYSDPAVDIKIGSLATTGETWNGSIDDVRIYNYALSPEQIAVLYENRTDLIVSQETSLSEVWQACITPNDGDGDGTETCSETLTIAGPSDTCTYSAGSNWEVNLTDNCVVTSDVDLAGYNVTFVDNGTFTFNATMNISDWSIDSTGSPATQWIKLNSTAVVNLGK